MKKHRIIFTFFFILIIPALLAQGILSYGCNFDKNQKSFSQLSQDKTLFSFVVVSDLHLNEKKGIDNFIRFLKQVNEIPEKPDFILVTGDIHVGPFEKILSENKFNIPFHVTPGNHEDRQDRDKLAEMFPNDLKEKDFYSFSHKNSFFISLCTAAVKDHVGHFDSEDIKGQNQTEWFESELACNYNIADHIFIFSHIPPSPEGVAGNMFLSTNDQKFLRDMVFKYNPSAMFFGHLHQKMNFKIGNTPVYVLPSLNWNAKNEINGFYIVEVKSSIEIIFSPLNDE